MRTDEEYLKSLNFQIQLNTLKDRSENVFVLGELRDRFHIIKSGNKYFVLDQMAYLGSGSFAETYKGYPLDTEGNLQLDHPVTIKKFRAERGSTQVVEDEFQLARFHHQMELPFLDLKKKRFYLIGEYLPGNPIEEKDLNSEIDELNFAQRCLLLAALASDVQLTHENTSARGPSIIHLDIKSENVLVKVNKDGRGKFKSLIVNLIDFGLSKLAKEKFKPGQSKNWGTPNSRAPEVHYNNHVTVKADVYALTGVAISTLGGKKAHQEKALSILTGEQACDQEYSLDGLFSNITLPKDLPIDIDQLVKQFLNHMQDQDVQKRADDQEVLRFFTTSHKLALIAEQEAGESYTQENKEHDITACSAKLILLANNFWNIKFKDTKFFEYFDFDENIEFCHSILELNRNGRLTSDSIEALIHLEEKSLHSKKEQESPDLIEAIKKKHPSEIHGMIQTLDLRQLFRAYEMLNLQKTELIEHWGTDKYNIVMSMLEVKIIDKIDPQWVGKRSDSSLFGTTRKERILNYIQKHPTAPEKTCRQEIERMDKLSAQTVCQ